MLFEGGIVRPDDPGHP